MAAAASPLTATASTVPFDSCFHAMASSSRARVASGSSTAGAGTARSSTGSSSGGGTSATSILWAR